jgi:hypothetical protein
VEASQMPKVEDAMATMIANFPAKTGRPIEAWIELVRSRGLTKHNDIVGYLKTEHRMSHGFAHRVALVGLAPADAPAGEGLVEAMYAGSKSALRPLHDAAVATVTAFGEDVELSPKKAWVSVRRSKQFATVGPGTGGRLEIGLNLRDVAPAGRLEAAANGMCTHRVRIGSAVELDDELRGWLRQAYDRAG